VYKNLQLSPPSQLKHQLLKLRFFSFSLKTIDNRSMAWSVVLENVHLTQRPRGILHVSAWNPALQNPESRRAYMPYLQHSSTTDYSYKIVLATFRCLLSRIFSVPHFLKSDVIPIDVVSFLGLKSHSKQNINFLVLRRTGLDRNWRWKRLMAKLSSNFQLIPKQHTYGLWTLRPRWVRIIIMRTSCIKSH
jgi:hypothetical protein